MPRSKDHKTSAERTVEVSDVLHVFDPSDPDLLRLIERANAAGSKERLEQPVRDWAASRLPPGSSLGTSEDVKDARGEILRLIRAASKPIVLRGWHLSGSRLIHHAESGHWADITIDVRPGPPPVLLFLFAVVSSPYLLRVFEQRDPEQRPEKFSGGHATLLWQVSVEYDPEATKRPRPLRIPQPPHHETGIVLGQDNAQVWLTDALGRLATTMEALCSDRALRDWLLDQPRGSVASLRHAMLLSRHLGDLAGHPDLVERTRIATEARDRAMMAKRPPIPNRDRGRDPLFWSHPRFLRFLRELTD